MTNSQTTTTKNDPMALAFAAALIGLALFGGFAHIGPPQVEAQRIVILTPTPSLPTAQPVMIELAPPTPAPILAAQEAAPAPEAPEAVSFPAAPQIAPENAAQESIDNSAYLANVGAQAEHSPRGDTDAPQSFATGPILYPDQNIVVVQPSAPNSGPAIAVPPISDQQAAIIGARQSATCPAGQTFYPRTGCHQEGSGGPQPGAVGEGQP